MQILIVEDNKQISDNIKLFLKDKKVKADQAFDGESGLHKAQSKNYDVIILDIMLPIMDGLSTCRQIREANVHTPIIMLTALDRTSQKISGLDAGADDYLAKPFDLDELYARLKALSRRKEILIPDKINYKNLTLDNDKKELKIKNQFVNLSPREFDLLHYLLKNANRVVSKEELIDNVWGGGDSLLFSETVEVHISGLRKKVDKDLIKTVRGSGYIIETD